MRLETLWAAGVTIFGGYTLLFMLARRPVTLRFVRLGWLLAVLTGVGGALAEPPEWLLTAVLGAIALALVLARRVWLVRATGPELREGVQAACRGLFLGVEEVSSGRLRLSAQ